MRLNGCRKERVQSTEESEAASWSYRESHREQKRATQGARNIPREPTREPEIIATEVKKEPEK